MKLKILFIALLISGLSWGQTNLATGGTYTENFNGLGASSTAALPANWKAQKTTTYREAAPSYVIGVTSVELAGGNSMSTTAGNGIYRFNANNVTTESALGGLSSAGNSRTVVFMSYFNNNAATAIGSFTVSYDVEKYRNGSNAAGFTIDLLYSTDGTTWVSCGGTLTTSFAADADNLGYVTAPATTIAVTGTYTPASSIALNGKFYFAWRYSVTSTTTSSNAQALGFDNFSITANSACTPPANPTGLISGTTPACNSTSLSFSGSATAPVVNYWQTTATGTSTANDASSALTVSALGTNNYFVRAFNSSTSCWSTNAVGPYAVTINAVPTVTTNPSNATTAEGSNASFTVVPSSAGSYQWQVNTGSGFTTITNGGVYSGVTTTTLTITGAPITMNGYIYQCLIVASAPCVGGAVSSSATLTVTPVYSAASDIIAIAGSEQATISSTVNGVTISAVTDGVRVLQIRVRDGGSTNDADAYATILTGFTIAQSAGNSVATWSDAIFSIGLFDGTTFVANGTVTANQIQFTGLNLSVADGGFKNLDLRLSLKCPLGAGAIDGDDFGFSISAANSTFSASGSGKAAFSAATSANSFNIINVIATKLYFFTQPSSTGLNNTMSSVVVRAYDACNNLDIGFVGTVSLASSGTMTAITPVTAVAGVATFSGIVHTATGTGLQLTASSTVTAAISTTFDIQPITVLNPGDIAVLAVNSNISSGNDEISFVTFVDITPGTRIDITDNAYQKCGTPNGWGISEGWVRFERTNSTLLKGSIITILVTAAGGTPSVVSPDPTNWVCTKPQPSSQGTFNLNNGGEQIFFMSGGSVGGLNVITAASDAGTYSGYFLFGFNTRGNVWTPVCATSNLDVNLSGTQNSDKPQNFNCFLTWPTSQSDLNKYTGPMTSATQRDWVSRIGNSANWTGYADNTAYNAGPNFYGASITILNGGYSNGIWIGDVNTDWFDCSNWQSRKVPDSTVNVTVGTNATQGVKIDITSLNAISFGNLAKCNNLSITEQNVTIEASTSNILEVYGNLSISGTGSLDMDDGNTSNPDGIIKLSRDWNNSVGDVAFSEGNGTVEFVGTTNQVISSVATEGTETYYNVILNNNFDTSISNNLIASGDLTINATKTLTVTANGYVRVNNKVTNNGQFTIESNGQLIQVNETDTNNGDYSGTKFTVKRNYTARDIDYVYWSAPTKLFTVASLPNGYRYEWNTVFSNSNGTFGNWVAPSAATMTSGKGYIARTFNGSSSPATNTFSFKGQPNNGQFSIPISRGPIQGLVTDPPLSYPIVGSAIKWDDNWNLVGNPYPSAINALTFLTDSNNQDIEGFVYVWSHGTVPSTSITDPFYYDFASNYTTDDYIIYNGTGTVSGPAGFNGKIASGQAFFVLMKDGLAASSTVTFNNAMRRNTTSNAAYNNTQFYRNSLVEQTVVGEEEKNRIWLDIISPQNAVKRTLIGYVETATNSKDRLFDGVTKPNSLDIYSFVDNDVVQEYCIQGRALPFNDSDKVTLGIKVATAGIYKIAINTVDGFFSQNQPIFLEDKLQNIIHDLRQSPYSFTAAAGKFDDRFILRYTNTTLGNPDFETLNNSVIVSTNHGELTIKSAIENMQDVTVYDILGRQLFEAKDVSNNEFSTSAIKAGQQALIVKITLENGTVVTRKIIL